jgi:hypothetical protein
MSHSSLSLTKPCTQLHWQQNALGPVRPNGPFSDLSLKELGSVYLDHDSSLL